jgi:hypothetical protein
MLQMLQAPPSQQNSKLQRAGRGSRSGPVAAHRGFYRYTHGLQGAGGGGRQTYRGSRAAHEGAGRPMRSRGSL